VWGGVLADDAVKGLRETMRTSREVKKYIGDHTTPVLMEIVTWLLKIRDRPFYLGKGVVKMTLMIKKKIKPAENVLWIKVNNYFPYGTQEISRPICGSTINQAPEERKN